MPLLNHCQLVDEFVVVRHNYKTKFLNKMARITSRNHQLVGLTQLEFVAVDRLVVVVDIQVVGVVDIQVVVGDIRVELGIDKVELLVGVADNNLVGVHSDSSPAARLPKVIEFYLLSTRFHRKIEKPFHT